MYRLCRTAIVAGLIVCSSSATGFAQRFRPTQSAGVAMVFNGVEAIAQSEPCTAFYTDNEVGTTLCSVYTGTVTGNSVGKGWGPAIINMTIVGTDFTNSSPKGCYGMYMNVQFAGLGDSQTLYGFGSLCGPTGANPPLQSGASLVTSGGYAIVASQAGASGTGMFSGTFTPEKGVAGNNLVINFSPAAQATALSH